MTTYDRLALSLHQFADLDPEVFELSKNSWQQQTYKKWEYFNSHKQVCKYLGFIIDGVFRSYIIDLKSGDEKNVFLYSSSQFVVSYKSFINQTPCDYYTQSMTDSTILSIHIHELERLYKASHAWERFGRLLAQEAFMATMDRTESFLFKTPEERYLELIDQHPDIFNHIPLYHISSYLGIQGPSLSRIRKRISGK